MLVMKSIQHGKEETVLPNLENALYYSMVALRLRMEDRKSLLLLPSNPAGTKNI
uniref:Uncharacterized protein n=1 Tax=Arundo donax TaxID=35708 RepID=A0A0A8YDW7_ARUDO